jgi:serine/threonine protein kinase
MKRRIRVIEEPNSPATPVKKRRRIACPRITLEQFIGKTVCFVGKFGNLRHVDLANQWQSVISNCTIAKCVSAKVDVVVIFDGNSDYFWNNNYKKACDMEIDIIKYSHVKHLLNDEDNNDGDIIAVDKIEKLKTMTDEDHAKLEEELGRCVPFEVKGDDTKFVASTCLSSGGNAVIFEAYEKSDKSKKKQYIIKVDRNLADEVDALQALSHECIIELLAYGKVKLSDRVFDYIVVPKYKQLPYEVITDENKLADIDLIRKLAFIMIDTVHYCHQKNYVLRDLKVDNLVIEPKQDYEDGDLPFNLIFIDFGAAVRVEKGNEGIYIYCDTQEVITESCGTPGYMAKEVSETDTDYGPKCDIFSLGMTLAELSFGRQFSQEPNAVRLIMQSFPPTKLLTTKERDFKLLLHGMLDEYQETRLSIQECKDHEFFLDY